MIPWKRYTTALLSIAILSGSLWATSATAKPGHGKNKPRSTETVLPVSGSTTQTRTQLITLNSSQRTSLVSLLRGTSSQNTLISSVTRTQIASQLSSLPPGIQKQVMRGKGLPPGIAKKVLLPKTVNTYLNLPTQCDLLVIGSNLVVVDSVSRLVTDVMTQVL